MMKPKILAILGGLAASAMLLSACANGNSPSVDAAAISTAAAKTVEARFTQQASLSTATAPAPLASASPQASPTLGFPPSATTQAGQPTPTANGKACYAASFVADVTIPDGMIIAPGASFKKTWRIRNDGNCVWDSQYSLKFDKGDALGGTTSVPLTSSVGPGQSVDLSVDLTAPTTLGDYSNYWRIATPYGGSFGVGSYDQSLIVKITVSDKPDRDFGSVSVVYNVTRKPAKGCGPNGAEYIFTASVTANAAGEFNYRWDRNPFDGLVEDGRLKFSEAGTKVVSFTWSMHNDAVQDIDRWVSLTTIVDGKETYYDRVTFKFSCTP